MNAENTVVVTDLGAKGDGRTDCFSPIQKALSGDCRTVIFPRGIYITSRTLKVHSHKKLLFEDGATLKMKASSPLKRGDFLLCNSNYADGNTDITIEGGILDGNNTWKYHKRPKDIFDKNGYSGALINFFNVTDFHMKNVRLESPVAYFTRFCKMDNFSLENIKLSTRRIMPNQDGIHFSGEVRNGVVKNISAETFGTTNDDLIAFNADDYLQRIECFDTVNGTIENIVLENIYSESSHCAIRLLSYESTISDITIRNMTAGFRTKAINCDASRDCRTHLFRDEDYPMGVGKIKNVTIENSTFFKANYYPLFWRGSVDSCKNPSAILLESLADNLVIKNCKFLQSPRSKPKFLLKNIILSKKIASKHTNLLFARYVTHTQIVADDKVYCLTDKNQQLTVDSAQNLIVLHK